MGRKARQQREIVIGKKVSPFFLEVEAAKYLRMDLTTLRSHRKSLTGPPYRRHGGSIIYHENDLDDWSNVCVATT